jgi:hypothetical protein
MPDFDPLESSDSMISHWLADHHDQIVETRVFNGVAVVLVDYQ